jgi:hypothetical protein
MIPQFVTDALASDGYGGELVSLARTDCTYEETHKGLPTRNGVRYYRLQNVTYVTICVTLV